MIRKRSWVFVGLFLLCVGASLLWRGRPEAHRIPGELANKPTATTHNRSTFAAGSGLEPITPESDFVSTQPPRSVLATKFGTLNHNHIEFYGRAVDQFGQAVPGASVRATVLVNTGSRGAEIQRNTVSDAEGYFQFTGISGQDLGIGLSKDGYEYRPKNSSFSYSYFEADHKRHIPDPKNPVRFELWKKQGAEPMVHYDKVWRVPLSAGPVKLDLVRGAIVSSDEDVIISISRTPLRMRFAERGFAWTVRVDVTGGGIIRAGEQTYFNEAPLSGYEPFFDDVQEAQSIRDAQQQRINWTWREDVFGTFFVSSRNGKNFARVNLRIRPNVDRNEGDNEAAIAAVVWMNPNGSRNLEFDPTKSISSAR